MLSPKKTTNILTALLLLFVSVQMLAQEPVQQKVTNKGKFYVYWGWNRGTFSDSDIHFKGENYDFILSDVVASDRPTRFGFDPYFKLDRITIPQTNVRIGYFSRKLYDFYRGRSYEIRCSIISISIR